MKKESKFVRRKRGVPCPVCGHESWCTVSADGVVVRCMRVASSRESNGGDGSLGWLHTDAVEQPVEVEKAQDTKRLTVAQVTARARSAYEHRMAKETRERLSVTLGVSVESLDALRVGYGCDRDGREWSSWPCRNAKGEVVGISRRYQDGSKKTMQGTKSGLYYAAERNGLKGPILIVEGGSDVAAAYTVGIPAIGRPSNTGGASWIRQLIGRKRCIVIGENDCQPERRGKLEHCPATCFGCGHCWPGLFGARIVSEKLRCRFVMPPLGFKDFREVVRSGGWWELLRACK